MEFDSAIALDDLDQLKYLVDGCDINMDIGKGNTLLHRACEYNRYNIVLFLLQNGANPNIKDNECFRTPLHLASMYATQQICELLMVNGADINDKAGGDMTPLMNAANRGDVSLVEYFLENGAHINDVTVQGYTALFWATVNNKPETVEILLKNGANKYIIDQMTQRTPKEWAQEREYENIICMFDEIDI